MIPRVRSVPSPGVRTRLPSDWRTIDALDLPYQARSRGPIKSQVARDLLAQFVQQREDIASQLLNGIRAGCDRGLAVATGVVAQDLELFLERRHLRIPHGESSPEGVGKYECGRAGRAGEIVVEAHVLQ